MDSSRLQTRNDSNKITLKIEYRIETSGFFFFLVREFYIRSMHQRLERYVPQPTECFLKALVQRCLNFTYPIVHRRQTGLVRVAWQKFERREIETDWEASGGISGYFELRSNSDPTKMALFVIIPTQLGQSPPIKSHNNLLKM